jgi:hypothetical protein
MIFFCVTKMTYCVIIFYPLNLAENGLEHIGVGTFDLMENLKMLDLSKNHSLLK